MKIVQDQPNLNQSQQGHQQHGKQRGSDEASRSLERGNGSCGGGSGGGLASNGWCLGGNTGRLTGYSWGLGDNGDDLSTRCGQNNGNFAGRSSLGSLSDCSGGGSFGGCACWSSLGDWTPGDIRGDGALNFGGGPSVSGRGNGGVALVFVA